MISYDIDFDFLFFKRYIKTLIKENQKKYGRVVCVDIHIYIFSRIKKLYITYIYLALLHPWTHRQTIPVHNTPFFSLLFLYIHIKFHNDDTNHSYWRITPAHKSISEYPSTSDILWSREGQCQQTAENLLVDSGNWRSCKPNRAMDAYP